MNYFIILEFLFAALGLYIGSLLLISGAVKISKKFNLSDFLIGTTVIAIATSLPELLILINSANVPEHSNNFIYGTILGSNVANTCLILGGTLLITFKSRFKFEVKKIKQNYIIIFLATLLFCMYGIINTKIILFFLILATAFFYFKNYSDNSNNVGDFNKSEISISRAVLYIIFGSLTIYGSSNALVNIAVKFIDIFGIDNTFVSSIFMALSTSSPEIITSLISVYKYQKNDFVLGNIFGSNIANFLIFSIISILYGISFPIFSNFTILLLLLAEFMMLLIVFLPTRKNILPNYCGIFLVFIYIIFVVKL